MSKRPPVSKTPPREQSSASPDPGAALPRHTCKHCGHHNVYTVVASTGECLSKGNCLWRKARRDQGAKT